MQQLKDLMSRDVKVLSPETTLREAARQMREGGFGLMPVGENDRLIGTLSDRDIVIRAVAQGLDTDEQVRAVMSEDLVWAYENDSVDKACRLMSDHQIRRLPVINADKRLVGIVALGDLAVDAADLQPAGEALSNISRPH